RLHQAFEIFEYDLCAFLKIVRAVLEENHEAKCRDQKQHQPEEFSDEGHWALTIDGRGSRSNHGFNSGTSTQARFSHDSRPFSASCTPFAPSRSVQRNGASLTTCLRNISHWTLNALS